VLSFPFFVLFGVLLTYLLVFKSSSSHFSEYSSLFIALTFLSQSCTKNIFIQPSWFFLSISYIYLFICLFQWESGLNSGLWSFKANALPLEPHLQSLLLFILEAGSYRLFIWLPRTKILQISASQVARITSQQCLSTLSLTLTELENSHCVLHLYLFQKWKLYEYSVYLHM
jgi:hypothetical protein